MPTKTKEVLKKLEFGIVEFLVGALMLIGLVGYFASVTADLDWIDHTVSFILFSYLFYKLDITSILFGKSSKFANSIIIISYFSLFFKDIISYTKLDAFKFIFLKFVDYFYLFLQNNLALTSIITFYIGILGLFIISIYLTKKTEISHPSFLYAIYQKEIKNKLLKFLSIFVLLLGFYYFVYNIILEWLEFVIDDPIIATGIIFFIYNIAKNHQKFHADNFIFKIGDFSSSLYNRFVSLFHYKKTLPLAISGLLILHALSDLGVFAYSLIFLRENFYLEFLREEHIPFLKLFLADVKNLPSFAAIPLFINYLLNALSLVTFLLIPIIVWAQMFSQKEFHFNRIFLFFIYSSAVAYMMLPGYIITPITEFSIKGEGIVVGGVDIITVSLLESRSILDNFFPNKTSIIVSVSLISIIFGLAIHLLSSNAKAKKELYAISIIGGLAFYAIYIFYFFTGFLNFYDNDLFEILSSHFLIVTVLVLFLALSIIFYIGGYLIFLYEIVMEYHKRKWSEPIDEELVTAIRKIKSFERRMIKPKKAQIGEVFKYVLVVVVSIIVLFVGYKMINTVRERACLTEITKFEIDLKGLDKSLRYGSKELQSHNAPCKAEQIYFFDLNKDINPEYFDEIPLLKDSLKSGGNDNVFVVKNGDVKRSFYAGNLEMVYPYYICFLPKFDKISFFAEGAGKSAKIAAACDQPECTFIPIEISEVEAKKIIKEAIDFCRNCQKDFDKEVEKMKLTRQNVEMLRKFTFCDGITTIEIIIKPKEGVEVKDFRFYEFIPKNCIDDLNKYLVGNVEGDVEVKAEPLILWYFEDLGKEKKISYKLNTELNDECRQAIQGLGVAQFIKGEAKEEQKVKGSNTPPTISELPEVSISGVKLHKNVLPNLWQYAKDKETEPRNLVYTVVDQTNMDLVDCYVNNKKHVDCEVKRNEEGNSIVTIQVDDFEFQDRASFNVEVTKFCKTHSRKDCIGNQVYWFDSCERQEEFEKSCESNEKCELGECKSACTPRFEKKCDGDDIYWFDSCGNKGERFVKCKDKVWFGVSKCRGKCCRGGVTDYAYYCA